VSSEFREIVLYSIGVVYAVFLPWPLIRKIQNDVWRRILAHNRIDTRLLQADLLALPVILGLLERALYFASIIVERPDFIGVWLLVKVAGGWSGWSSGRRFRWHEEGHVLLTERTIPGAQVFNAHLIGTSLSLLFAATGAYGIRWCVNQHQDVTLYVSTTVLFTVFLLSAFLHYVDKSAPVLANLPLSTVDRVQSNTQASALDPRSRWQRIFDVVVAIVAPARIVARLAEADFEVTKRRQPDLRKLSAAEQIRMRQESVNSTHFRMTLLRRVHSKAVTLVLSAVLVGVAAAALLPHMTLRIRSIIGLSSVLLFGWATLARLGWNGQSLKGDTTIERLDDVWFRSLYWAATVLATLSVA